MRCKPITSLATATLVSVSLMIALFNHPPLFAETTPPAQQTPPSPSFNETIKPYSATYSTVWKKGIRLTIEGTQTLERKPDDTWLFSFYAKTFFASLKESSLFKVNDNQIHPLRYEYHTKAFGKKRDATLTFDWQKQKVTNDVKDTKWRMAITSGVLDKLSLQLQIRYDIRSKKETLSYQVADGGYLKTRTFTRLGTETIETKLGNIKAIKVVRSDNQEKNKKSTFWFAEEYDYLLVKLEHQEDNEFYRLELESIH